MNAFVTLTVMAYREWNVNERLLLRPEIQIIHRIRVWYGLTLVEHCFSGPWCFSVKYVEQSLFPFCSWENWGYQKSNWPDSQTQPLINSSHGLVGWHLLPEKSPRDGKLRLGVSCQFPAANTGDLLWPDVLGIPRVLGMTSDRKGNIGKKWLVAVSWRINLRKHIVQGQPSLLHCRRHQGVSFCPSCGVNPLFPWVATDPRATLGTRSNMVFV